MRIPPDDSDVAPSVKSLCLRIGTGLKAEIVAVDRDDGSTCGLFMACGKLSVDRKNDTEVISDSDLQRDPHS